MTYNLETLGTVLSLGKSYSHFAVFNIMLYHAQSRVVRKNLALANFVRFPHNFQVIVCEWRKSMPRFSYHQSKEI